MNEKGKLWLKIFIVAIVLVVVIGVVMLVEPLVGATDKAIYKPIVGDDKLQLIETTSENSYQYTTTSEKVEEVTITDEIVYNALPKNPSDDCYVFIALAKTNENGKKEYYYRGSKVKVNNKYQVVYTKLSLIKEVNETIISEYIDENTKTKECLFIGTMYQKDTNIKINTNGTKIEQSNLEDPNYSYVFMDIDFIDENNDNINDVSLASLPNKNIKGLSFAGWYHTSTFTNGTISSTNNSKTDNGTVYARYITYGDGGLVVLICMVIVFLMLALLCGITSLLKFLAPKEEAKVEQTKTVVENNLTLNDITDDMMAAALVASIDYHNEINKDVRVVSIREIR